MLVVAPPIRNSAAERAVAVRMRAKIQAVVALIVEFLNLR